MNKTSKTAIYEIVFYCRCNISPQRQQLQTAQTLTALQARTSKLVRLLSLLGGSQGRNLGVSHRGSPSGCWPVWFLLSRAHVVRWPIHISLPTLRWADWQPSFHLRSPFTTLGRQVFEWVTRRQEAWRDPLESCPPQYRHIYVQPKVFSGSF